VVPSRPLRGRGVGDLGCLYVGRRRVHSDPGFETRDASSTQKLSIDCVSNIAPHWGWCGMPSEVSRQDTGLPRFNVSAQPYGLLTGRNNGRSFITAQFNFKHDQSVAPPCCLRVRLLYMSASFLLLKNSRYPQQNTRLFDRKLYRYSTPTSEFHSFHPTIDSARRVFHYAYIRLLPTETLETLETGSIKPRKRLSFIA
jgi:hypothetical protein